MSPQKEKQVDITPIAEDALKAQKPIQRPLPDLSTFTPQLITAKKSYQEDLQGAIVAFRVGSEDIFSKLGNKNSESVIYKMLFV